MKQLLVLFLAVTLRLPAQSEIEMPALFSDNMVLQQRTLVPFWGKAPAGANLFIDCSWGAKSKTKVAPDGNWMVKVKTPPAGGPYDLKIRIGGSELNFKNVLVGEVWICSGQSNMEMPLAGWPPSDTIKGAAEAIKNSTNPQIRFITVTRAYSTKPQFNCSGRWVESNPVTAASFSATAFFFGQKLFEELKVPIGLIHTSWGGTPVESWTGGKFLTRHNDYKDFISMLEASQSEFEKLKDWIESHPLIDVNNKEEAAKWIGLDFNDGNCPLPGFDDSNWREMKLPVSWESTELGDFDGVVWFRKKIEIPDAWIGKEIKLLLAMIDDMDAAFVNGVKVGGYEVDGHWQTMRIYSVPADIVKDKIMTIAVRVIDNQGGGGIWGQPEFLKAECPTLSEAIPLDGNWKYLPVAEYIAGKFFVYGSVKEEFYNRPKLPVNLSAYTPTVLYNAMIHPLIPYAIKGVIWYQGESNTSRPEAYEELFKLMIENWRSNWKQGDFPFYFTQIAPYKYGVGTNSQKLREAQFKSLLVKNTGMAVTLDIGDPFNIHPSNKKDVGERLALWALAKDYGKKNGFSGPLYKSMKRTGSRILLKFDYGDGMFLNTYGGQTNFEIAGEDRVFKKAEVFIENKKVHVYNNSIPKPAAVRYCWNDTSAATLFNKYLLPASSFRTDDWEE